MMKTMNVWGLSIAILVVMMTCFTLVVSATTDPFDGAIIPTTYTITATVNNSEHGTVVADKSVASAGDTVTLTVTPKENYEIDTVEYNDGTNDVEITATEGVYSFTMPANNVTVLATFKLVAHTHPICGSTHTDTGDHKGNCEDIEWTAWDGTGACPQGNVYLTADVTITSALGARSICLNGYQINRDGNVFNLEEGTVLNICDCNGSGTVKSTKSATYSIVNYGTVNVYSGNVECTVRNSIYNSNGILNIYGGTVNGGIYNTKGTITVSGGTVTSDYYACIQNDSGDIIVSGGIVTSPSTIKYGIFNQCTSGGIGSITVSGGKLEAISSSGYGIYISNSEAEVIVSGNGVVSGGGYGVCNNKGTVGVSVGDTATVSGGIYGIFNLNQSTVDISVSDTATLSGNEYGIYNEYNSTTAVTVSDTATVIGGNYGIYNEINEDNKGITTKSTTDVTVSHTATVSGGIYGIYDSTVNLSGAPVIIGTDVDIHLANNRLITINETGLINTSSYTVETGTAPAKDSPIQISVANDTDYSTNFVPAVQRKYEVIYNDSDKYLYLTMNDDPTYTISVNTITNGTVVPDKETAIEGDMVILTLTPEVGYEIDTLTIDGADVTESVLDNQYTFIMPNDNVTVSATFKEIDYLKITNMSLLLDGRVGMKVYFEYKLIDTDTLAFGGIMNNFNDSSSDEKSYDITLEPDGKTAYAIVYFAPKDVDNMSFDALITAQTLHDTQVILDDISTLSIPVYIEVFRALDPTDERRIAYEGLINSLDNYCAYADAYFDSSKTALSDIELTDAEIEEIVSFGESAYVTSESTESLEFYGSSLVLEETVTLRHYFKLKSSATPDDFTVSGGTELSFAKDSEAYVYTDVAQIPAYDLSLTTELRVYSDNTDITVNCTPLIYVAINHNNSNTRLSNLLKALYRYYIEAKALK